MIKFSIITCTYNAAKELQPTLDSVMNQQYKYVEHLIIDGNSTDGTAAMATDYKLLCEQQENMHDVVVKSEPDRGLYDAMNKGLRLATGSYVVFLNAGDTLPQPDTLEVIADTVGEGERLPGVLYGFTDIVDANGRLLRHRRLQPPEHLTWRSFCRGMLVCHQAFYVRTDIAQSQPYNLAYHYSADVDWCIRVMKETDRLHLPLRRVNAVVANYLDGGMTNHNHWASLKERFRIMVRHYGLVTTLIMHGYFVLRSIIKE